MAITINKYGYAVDDQGRDIGIAKRTDGESEADYLNRAQARVGYTNGTNPNYSVDSNGIGRVTPTQPIVPVVNPMAQLEALKQAQLKQTLAGLDKSRSASLSNLEAEKATIEPQYQKQKTAALVTAKKTQRSFDDYLAQRGSTRSGIGGQGTLLNNVAYQGQKGALDQGEASAISDNARRVTGVQNAYESDKAAANAGVEAQYLQNYITQMNQDRAFNQATEQFAKNFGLSEAGVTGTYNGQSTLAAQQAALNKAIQEAQLTGMYNGQTTLPAQQWNQTFESNNAQQAFANKLAEEQLALSQQKALSGGSGGSGGGTATERKQMAYGDALSKVQDWVTQGYTPQQIKNILYNNASDFAYAGINIDDLYQMANNIYQNNRFNSNGGHYVE